VADNTTLNINTTAGDSIRDLARQSGSVKTQVFQLDIGGPTANAEVLVTSGQQLSSASLPVVIASNQTAIPVSGAIPTNVNVSGTFTASDAVVAAPIGDGTLINGASTSGSIVFAAIPSGLVSWTLLIKGYVSGTIYIESSTNSTTGIDGDWVELKGRRTGTAPGIESIMYAMISNGYYRGNASGFTYIRARLIGGVGPNIQFILSNGQGATFLNSGIPLGDSNIGRVKITDGINVAAVKSASTIAVAADPSSVIAISPNSNSVNISTSTGSQPAVSGSISAAIADTPGVVTTTSGTGQIITNVSNSGNVTFHIVTSAFVGTLYFEASINGGANYAQTIVLREDGTGSESIISISTASSFIKVYTFGAPGFTHFRVRCSAFTSGSISVYVTQGPLLIEPNPSLSASNAIIGTVNINSSAPNTYGAAIVNLALAATATDIFTISGSATKTIKITKVHLNGIQTTAGQINVSFMKRSSLNSGGTSTVPVAIPYDSLNTAATAVVAAYTANPTTLGTVVGTIYAERVFLPGAATASDAQGLQVSYSDFGQQSFVLRGLTQLFCFNLVGVTVVGGSVNVSIEWTES
jgi:hypothetical protein